MCPAGIGYTAKIHAVVDALGNPVKIQLTGGHVSDYTPAKDLIGCFDLEGCYFLADKGYDSKELVGVTEDKGGMPVIPSRKNAKEPRNYDKHFYKDRYLVENFFLRLKNNRRIATCYEKTLTNFLCMVQLASILIWLL